MREPDTAQIDQVSGGVLVNVGMGMAGALGGMAGYSLAGGISGSMSGTGFLNAGVAGFVTGAGGFNGASAIAGAAAGGAAERLAKDS